MPTKKLSTALVMLSAILLMLVSLAGNTPNTQAATNCATWTCQGPSNGFGGCNSCCQECNGECISPKYICILEPLPGGPHFLKPSTKPFENFKDYLNNGLWQLLFAIGVGSVVFNGVIAGIQIVFSNGDSGAIGTAKTKLIWSLVGLIILIMSGVIMAFINPVAFQNV